MVTKEIQLVKSNMEKFTTAFTFDLIWLANEMKHEGLLAEDDYENVTQLKNVTDSQKDFTMYCSLMKKVKLSYENLEKLTIFSKNIRIL